MEGIEEKVNATAARTVNSGGVVERVDATIGGGHAQHRRCCGLTATGRIQSAAGLGTCWM